MKILITILCVFLVLILGGTTILLFFVGAQSTDEDVGLPLLWVSLVFGFATYKVYKDHDKPSDIYKNPNNNYTEEISALAWLWVLIFGCFYFLFKGVIRHFFLSLFLSLMTVGLAWLIYPFFAKDIIRNHYKRQGWVEVENH